MFSGISLIEQTSNTKGIGLKFYSGSINIKSSLSTLEPQVINLKTVTYSSLQFFVYNS